METCNDNLLDLHIYKGGYEENNSPLNYNKEGLLKFDYMLSEHKGLNGYTVIGTAYGHPWFDWKQRRVRTKEAIFVLEKSL
jgi:hypothetical protein